MPERAAPHIVVIDDDPEVRAILRECFEMEGYTVAEGSNGAELRKHLAAMPVSLITLDLSLGGDDGLSLAREIRARGDVPIIMVTGKADMIDRVVGLEVGADDYITKPFHLREVLARVRSVLRRFEAAKRDTDPAMAAGPSHERYSFGPWIIDLNARELLGSGGANCELTTAEFNLLALFVRKPHFALSRDMIMDQLKGHEWSPFDRSIDTLIGRLRKKIERDPGAPQLIKTVRSVGYMFAADVHRA